MEYFTQAQCDLILQCEYKAYPKNNNTNSKYKLNELN